MFRFMIWILVLINVSCEINEIKSDVSSVCSHAAAVANRHSHYRRPGLLML